MAKLAILASALGLVLALSVSSWAQTIKNGEPTGLVINALSGNVAAGVSVTFVSSTGAGFNWVTQACASAAGCAVKHHGTTLAKGDKCNTFSPGLVMLDADFVCDNTAGTEDCSCVTSGIFSKK